MDTLIGAWDAQNKVCSNLIKETGSKNIFAKTKGQSVWECDRAFTYEGNPPPPPPCLLYYSSIT